MCPGEQQTKKNHESFERKAKLGKPTGTEKKNYESFKRKAKLGKPTGEVRQTYGTPNKANPRSLLAGLWRAASPWERRDGKFYYPVV